MLPANRFTRVSATSVALAMAVSLALSNAEAKVLCQKRSGMLALRDACEKRETVVDSRQFGIATPGEQGPQGAPGVPGPKGDPGEAGQQVAQLAAQNAELEARLAKLETLLTSVSLVQGGQTIRFTGVNVQIVSGSGSTQADPPNGLGNLIVGYNELRGEDCDETEGPSCEYPQTYCPPWDYDYCNCVNSRWGSHNIVVGSGNNYSSSGGLVVGRFNAIDGRYSSVAGGDCNSAAESFATVAGGRANRAMGEGAAVLGGTRSVAVGAMSSIIGGDFNAAVGLRSIAGGSGNRARGDDSAAIGGFANEAQGQYSSVSGGRQRVAPGESDWAAGGLFEDQ